MRQRLKRCLLILAAASLSGCFFFEGGDQSDIQAWMNKESKDLKPDLKPLPEIKPFPVVSYEPVLLDPFSTGKVVADAKKGALAGLPPEEVDRAKEELEAFPLEAIRLVGLIRKGGVTEAIISADRRIYRVRKGMHMGLERGKVVDIRVSAGLDEGTVILSEWVQDSDGNWVSRENKLGLQQQEARK